MTCYGKTGRADAPLTILIFCAVSAIPTFYSHCARIACLVCSLLLYRLLLLLLLSSCCIYQQLTATTQWVQEKDVSRHTWKCVAQGLACILRWEKTLTDPQPWKNSPFDSIKNPSWAPRLILFFFLPFSSLREPSTGRTNLQVWMDRSRGRYDSSLNTQGGTVGEWCEDVSFLRITSFTRQWLDNLLGPWFTREEREMNQRIHQMLFFLFFFR